MFKFLLVMFLLTPDGQVMVAKEPQATLQECLAEGQATIKEAAEVGLIVVGTCVEPKDYIAAS